jgi:hypothetical protein
LSTIPDTVFEVEQQMQLSTTLMLKPIVEAGVVTPAVNIAMARVVPEGV